MKKHFQWKNNMFDKIDKNHLQSMGFNKGAEEIFTSVNSMIHDISSATSKRKSLDWQALTGVFFYEYKCSVAKKTVQ